MKNTHTILSLALLTTSAACSKPSDRYQGISEPREITAERSPGTVAVASAAEHDGGDHIGPASGDLDKRGTVNPTLNPNEPAIGEVGDARERASGTPREREGRAARAVFKSASGVKLEGSADLEEVQGGVRVRVDVRHPKRGVHGLHVHERADCSDIRNKSMGGHFAPDRKQHGLPGYAEHHLGDLGNLTIQKTGTGELEITVPYATLEKGGSHSFLGRALVIHAAKDKGHEAQPAGDSGEPIACAVIEPA